MATRTQYIVEVEGYESEDGQIVVENLRADGSPRYGAADKIYCIGSLGSDGVMRFNDWGYATAEEAREALDAANRHRKSGSRAGMTQAQHRTRELTWAEIEDEFGPLTEIPPAANGRWDVEAIRDALRSNLLWTRVEPGLVSTGFRYINRECYFRAARPYASTDHVVEVDPDLVECNACGDTYSDDGRGECPSCGATTPQR